MHCRAALNADSVTQVCSGVGALIFGAIHMSLNHSVGDTLKKLSRQSHRTPWSQVSVALLSRAACGRNRRQPFSLPRNGTLALPRRGRGRGCTGSSKSADPKFSRTLWSDDSKKNWYIFYAIRCQILKPKCTEFDYRWGSAPDRAEGAYSASPDPLAVFKGATSRGRRERVGRGTGGEGR